jgi:hypothetical protein
MRSRDQRSRPAPHAVYGAQSAWTASLGALLRLWPWVGSLAAAAFVDVLIGAVRHFDFTGIEGFSTTNYGWLAFSLVGGVGLAWRLAKQPARWRLPVRPLVAPALSFLACFVAVTVMGLLFLPHQPLTETLTTDAPGRAFWLSLLVAIGSGTCEALWRITRLVRGDLGVRRR